MEQTNKDLAERNGALQKQVSDLEATLSESSAEMEKNVKNLVRLTPTVFLW